MMKMMKMMMMILIIIVLYHVNIYISMAFWIENDQMFI